MTTDKEYAQLANRVYNRTEENRTPTPTGWKELSWAHDAAFSGFSAGVYQKGNDIVISYTGTNEGKAADFVLANVPIGLGATSVQVKEAMRLYFETKAAYPEANISFTGHSLGGGLASMMAVFFQKEAVIFDAAPFELGAHNPESLLSYRAWAIANGFTDAAFNSFTSTIDPADFAARENSVRSIALQGEILGVLRAYTATIYGGLEQTVAIGSQTLLNSGAIAVKAAQVELHSMTLLAAMLHSSSFSDAVNTNPQSLAAFFDSNLYARNPEISGTANFLDRLYIAQVSNPSTPLLDRFGSDLKRIGTEGMAAQGEVQKALTVAAMEYYYFKDAASATQLFSNDSNGIHLNLSDLGIDKSKSKAVPLLVKSMRPFIDSQDVTEGQLYAQDAWHIQSGTSGMFWSGGNTIVRDVAVGGAQTDVFDGGGGADILIGGAGSDFLTGGAGTDTLIGGVGNDVLNGGTGNDALVGGGGADIYQFTTGDGKDSIADSDGMGSIVLNGRTLATAKAAGERNQWKDANGVIYQFIPNESDTRGWLTIKSGETGDEVTIKNFDLTKAKADGYLGIKLDSTPKLAITAGGGTNVWSDPQFDATALQGQSASVAEGTGKIFTIFLNAAAKAGETLTLALGGIADKFKAVLGDRTVDADGAVITLAEGQTQVSFALVQEGEVTEDGSGALSVSYQGTDASASSNSFALNLIDTGEADNTFNGDFLVKTETRNGLPITRVNTAGLEVEVVASGALYYVRDANRNLAAGSEAPTYQNIYVDGNVVGVEEVLSDDVTVTTNTIYGTAGKDAINGLTGNDALSGGAGNDQIDGGPGDDMIGGGAGADTIKGGSGNDFISSSADIQIGRQLWSANDQWSQWGLPAGKTATVAGATWGAYQDQPGGSEVWSGITDTRVDTASTEGDHIEAGAGDDHVVGSWADDRIEGGDGKDELHGLAGDDIVEGGEGDDAIMADGIVIAGYLNTVAAVSHGNDFVDGGAGNDHINGGGGADQLFGGAGDDNLVGDSAGKTDNAFYVDLQYHGSDYIDGEDGDDIIEAGGKDDTLYGGAGNDSLWGDTSADNLVNESDNALMWGNDYLDGEDGNDQLVGGGKDDTLYGGKGDDNLFGDQQNIALKAEFQGQDYLDGEDGDDYLEGAAGQDTFTIKSIAAYASKPGATRRFDCENRYKNTKNQPSMRHPSRSDTQNTYARSARLAGQKGLGRRVDSAWTVVYLRILDGLLNDLPESAICHS